MGPMASIGLIAFFLLTFAFTWTAWLALAAPGHVLFGLGGPVFLLGVLRRRSWRSR
jgi:hypothetical protein